MSGRPHWRFWLEGATLFAALAVATLAPPRGLRAVTTWAEVRSPHFTVVSDVSERAARGVARQFEQFRAVLGRYWPWAKVDPGRPVIVYLLENEESLSPFVKDWSRLRAPSAAWYGVREDRCYIALRLSPDVDPNAPAPGRESARLGNPYRELYWPLVGVVVHATFGPRIPAWLQRGLGELMSNVVVTEDGAHVGQAPGHVRLAKPLPLERTMAAADRAAAVASLLAADAMEQEARAAIATVRSTAPGHRAAYDVEGWLEERAGRPDRARDAYSKVTDGDAGQSFAEYRRAALSWPNDDAPDPERRNSLEAIVELLGRSAARSPNYAPARALLATALLALGRTDEATTHARAAVALEPWAAAHRVVSARALASGGQVDHARTEAQAALRLHPTPEQRRRAEEVLNGLARTDRPAPRPPGWID